jgi:cytochrome P450
VWKQETPLGDRFWSATRYRDVARILMDDRRFSSAHGTILAVARGDSAGGKTINLMDPPAHAHVRLPTMRTMSTRLVRERKEAVRGHIRRMLAFEGDMAEVMLQLPMAGVGEIIGIPQDLWPQIPRWAMAGVAPSDPHFSVGTEEDTLRKAHHELIAMFSGLIAHRRRQPGDDLISVLLELDFGGRKLDDRELLLNCYSFAMGAITTTPQVASHMLLAFAEQPQAWQALRERPQLVPDAVEEALRWASPTNHLMRKVLEPVEVGQVKLEPGELICAWVGSANRDETVFVDPYTFDPARNPNPHLAFGVGAHRCIGGPPAQVALQTLLEELIGQVEGFEVTGEVTHLHSNFINGITSLPMILRDTSTPR